MEYSKSVEYSFRVITKKLREWQITIKVRGFPIQNINDA